MREQFSQIKTQSLPRNYRSLKLIVKFVNEILRDKFASYEDQIAANKLYNDLPASVLQKIKDYPLSHPRMPLFEVQSDDYGYVAAFSYDDVLKGLRSKRAGLLRSAA